MAYPSVDQISAHLAGTGITSLELSGPPGHVRLTNGAPPAPDITVRAQAAGRFRPRHPLARDTLAPVGTLVRPGAVIGLLQVGPLLLPVTSPSAGQVAAHLVADGTIVGYGTPLLALHPIQHETAP